MSDIVVRQSSCSYDRGAQIEDPAHLAALVEHKGAARQHRTSDALIYAVPAIRELLVRAAARGYMVLYDLSSSYFEGNTCPLARLGYSRDGRKGLLQVNYGLLTDARGCPLAVSVHEGNVADSATFLPEVKRLRERRARGFTRFETIKTAIFLIAGKFDFAAVNPRASQPT